MNPKHGNTLQADARSTEYDPTDSTNQTYLPKLGEDHSRSPEAGYLPKLGEDYSRSPEAGKITFSKSSQYQGLPKYETWDKRGLLIQINDKFESDMELALPFFEQNLSFKVFAYNSRTDSRNVQQFLNDVKEEITTNASTYYCVVFLISCHGREDGMKIGNDIISIGDMAKQFSNNDLDAFRGRPKVFVADCCRGESREFEITKKGGVEDQRSRHVIATQDSDIIIVFATTNGKIAWAKGVSLLHEALVETLWDKWTYSHLEEILIYVRNKVVNWTGEKEEKQTVEVITTLTRALTFKKFEPNEPSF